MFGVSYFEIHTDDPERAIHFYSDVFGWQFIKQDGIDSDYWRIEGAGLPGGLLPRPVPLSHSGTVNAFVCSVEVADFDTAASKIMELGGMVALPKFAVPGRCWQGYFIDTEKNVFGIFQVDEKAV